MNRARLDQRRLALALLFAATLAACAWLDGLLPPLFLAPDAKTAAAFDDQLISWLDGRWDLPRGGAEGFEVDGRVYIYFGPVPSLLRLPLAPWIPDHRGKSGWFLLFASVALAFAAALFLAREAGGEPPGILVGVAVVGPLLLIGSRPSLYHEAIAWGAAFVMLSAALLLRYRRTRDLSLLLGAGLCGVLAVLSRSTWLPAVVGLLALGFLGVRRAPAPRVHILAAAALLACTVGAPLAIHRLKFGEWGLVPPIARHVWFDAARVQRMGGGMFNLSNLRTGVWNYFSPAAVSYRRTFPFIHNVEPRIFPEARVDGSELFMSLPHVAGALMLLTAVGAASAWRRPQDRVPMAVAAALGLGSSSLLLFGGLCARYLFDFVPPLVAGGAVGAAALGRSRHARGLLVAVGVLALYNLLAGAASALLHQRWLAPPARRAQIEALARRIDGGP